MNFVKKQLFFAASIMLMAFIIISYVILLFEHPSIHKDSGYYLKIAYDLSNGMSFFNGLNCSYTPLGMYLLSIPFYVFSGEASIQSILICFLIIYMFIGLVFYKTAFYFNSNKKINFFATLLLLCLIFGLEGYHILLEPYVLLFQLLALYTLLKYETNKRTLIVVGVFVFLAFFAKQYGLFILPAIVFIMYKKSVTNKDLLVNLSLLSLGIFIPFLLLIVYFCFYNNIELISFLKQLSGIPVLSGEEIVTDVNYSVNGLYKSLKRVVAIFPFVFFFLGFIPLIVKKELSTITVFSMMLLFGASGTLFFAYWLHYFQLIIPYALLLLLSMPEIFYKRFSLVLGILFVFFLKASYIEFQRAKSKKVRVHARQNVVKDELSKYLQASDKVYLQGISPSFYFLNKFDSPNYSKLGYKFPEELSLHAMHTNLNDGQFIIVDYELINNQNFSNYKLIATFNYANMKKVILKK